MQNQDGRVLRKSKENHKKRSTGPSRVVPHRSTTPARTCLTSLFGWEAVSQADMAALDTTRFDLTLLSSLTPCPYGEQAGMDAGGVRTVYVRLLRSQLAVEESPRCRLNGAKRSFESYQESHSSFAWRVCQSSFHAFTRGLTAAKPRVV